MRLFMQDDSALEKSLKKLNQCVSGLLVSDINTDPLRTLGGDTSVPQDILQISAPSIIHRSVLLPVGRSQCNRNGAIKEKIIEQMVCISSSII